VDDALLEWYAEHRRDLSLRRTIDAYATTVSEVMLDQTQAAPGPGLRGRAGGKVRPKIVNCVGEEQT
jgi:hypothetical protein